MAVTGPDFIALQVRNLAEAAAFYEDVVGLIPAESSPLNAAVFQTLPVAFAVRQAGPGVDLGDHPGTGVALWLHDPEAATLHPSLAAAGVTIIQEPFAGPFGTTFTFRDPEGYAVTVHDQA